jgi:hypothetical protein
MIERYSRGNAAAEVDRSDPVHYRVKELRGDLWQGVAVLGDVEVVLLDRTVRCSPLEAKIDCILSGQMTLHQCLEIKSFTVED